MTYIIDGLGGGYLRVLGPPEGTFRTNGGNLTKPDIVISNRACYHYFRVENLDGNLSDHSPIKLTVSCSPIKIPCTPFENINLANWPLYNDYLKNSVAPLNLNNQPIVAIGDNILSLSEKIYNAKLLAIPISNHKLNSSNLTTDKFKRFQRVIIHLNILLENTRHDLILYNYYKNKKALAIERLKAEAFSIQARNWNNLLADLSSDRKLNPSWFWSKVKNIIKKNPRSEFRVTDTGTGQGNRLESFEDIENSFRTEWREHFSAPSPADIDPIALQVVNEFHDQNPDICKPHSHINLRRLDYSNDPLCNSTIKPFHPRDVKQVIFDFKNRAPGPDTIKRIHLFNAPNIFIVAITNIFNCALSAGLYPDKFKEGLMIFIAKPNKDHCHPKNYRPITLINIFGKIYGKLINNRFIKHMERFELYDPLQFGFRKGRGTTPSLALSYEYIARKKGTLTPHRVSVVSRDISGAFDRVWHQNLILLFTKLKLPLLFVKTMSNFLTDRKICIKIFNFIGPAFSMEAGVPQGAPDSPDTFNISTLPLGFNFDAIKRFTYSTWYCDDHLQIVANPHAGIGAHEFYVKRAIQTQNNFEKSRGIVNSVDKSSITPISAQLNIDRRGRCILDIPKKASCKVLGLNFKSYSFTAEQCEVQARRANEIVTAMYSLQGLDIKAKLHLVKALVITILTYPCTPLNTVSITGAQTLQSPLNKALNFVYSNHWPNSVTAKILHERAKIDPINLIIHDRAVRVWDKIAAGISADIETFNEIIDLPFDKPHCRLPSSYGRSRKNPPPRMYTKRDHHRPDILNYYNF